MKKLWKGLLWVFASLWAFIAVAATVPAHQAVSNLQSWAELFGLVELAKLLAAKGVDYLALFFTALGIIMFVLDILFHVELWKRAR